jgi:porin
MKKIYAAILGGGFFLFPAAILAAEQTPDAQSIFSDGSVAFSLLYRADVMANVSGGLKQRTTALGNLDIKLDFDLDKLLGWDGTSIGLHGIASHGGKPNANHVGSSQGIDNIEKLMSSDEMGLIEKIAA